MRNPKTRVCPFLSTMAKTGINKMQRSQSKIIHVMQVQIFCYLTTFFCCVSQFCKAVILFCFGRLSFFLFSSALFWCVTYFLLYEYNFSNKSRLDKFRCIHEFINSGWLRSNFYTVNLHWVLKNPG